MTGVTRTTLEADSLRLANLLGHSEVKGEHVQLAGIFSGLNLPSYEKGKLSTDVAGQIAEALDPSGTVFQLWDRFDKVRLEEPPHNMVSFGGSARRALRRLIPART